ncbi:HAD family hydrolase [Micromonospora sp. NPDC051141]|uniref:HAD family hydrolase n=1 Tax=Micromonospora sp. NPDC051141 TaxID=3364284 RepID=UPI0037ACD759
MLLVRAENRPLVVPRPIVEEYLHQVGLLDAFDAVVGCDDVPAPKPAPEMYLAACARLAGPRAAARPPDGATGARPGFVRRPRGHGTCFDIGY